VRKMKGYRRHLVASATVTALFAFCAFALGFTGAPVHENTYGGSQELREAAAEAPEVAPTVATHSVPEAAPASAVAGKAATPYTQVKVAKEAPAGMAEGFQAVPEAQAAAPSDRVRPGGEVNPPANLEATFTPGATPYVHLVWDINNEKKNVKCFLVYRAMIVESVEGEKVLVGEANIGDTKKATFKDKGIEAGNTYRYWVTTLSKTGEESKPCGPVDVVTYANVPPAAPQGLTAGIMDPGVGIEWAPNGEVGLVGYHVYLRGAQGAYSRLTTSPLSETCYYHRTGTAGSVYAVTAVNGYGTESAYAEVTAEQVVPVRYEEGDPAVTVEGYWVYEAHPDASGGKIRVAGSKGDRLRFSFTGRQVKMISAKYWTCGSANVYIDGKLVATVSLYNHDLVFGNLVVNATGLPYGQHVLTVEALGSGNPEADFNFVNVDAFEVW